MPMQANTASRITALLERFGRLLTTEAHADGMQPVHWETLRYLDRANRFSRTPAALTRYLGLTKGTVSQTLRALEAKRLIKKRIDPTDRRSRNLSLTAKGRSALKTDPLGATSTAVAALPNAAQRQLEAALNTLLIGSLRARDRQPFGQCRDCRFFGRRHPEGEPHFCRLLEEKLAEDDALAICVEQQPAVAS